MRFVVHKLLWLDSACMGGCLPCTQCSNGRLDNCSGRVHEGFRSLKAGGERGLREVTERQSQHT